MGNTNESSADKAIKQNKRDTYIYQNKSSILSMIALVIVLLLVLIYFIWSSAPSESTGELDMDLPEGI